jgi:hypothetical protein
VIVLAIAYWTALWLMGRRDDVLHGQFVNRDRPPAAPSGSRHAAQSANPLQSLLNSIEQDLKERSGISGF